MNEAMFRIRSLKDLMIYLDDVSFRDTGTVTFVPALSCTVRETAYMNTNRIRRTAAALRRKNNG